jgi:hypothetical protein
VSDSSFGERNWRSNKTDDQARLIILSTEVSTIFALKRDLRDIEGDFVE